MEGNRMSQLSPILLIHHSRFSAGGASGILSLVNQEEEIDMDTALRDRKSKVERRAKGK
jgi:hypothetical protein